MKRELETKYFKFRQNNSGGSFDIDEKRGIGVVVWVEGLNVEDACRRAESIGIYFNGVEGGSDCECCGDRWSAPWGDGVDKPELDGEWDFSWHDTVYVHHMNGGLDRHKAPAEATGAA